MPKKSKSERESREDFNVSILDSISSAIRQDAKEFNKPLHGVVEVALLEFLAKKKIERKLSLSKVAPKIMGRKVA